MIRLNEITATLTSAWLLTWKQKYPFIADKSKWPFAKDIYIWDEWPVRQSSLLFAGLAYENEDYINTFLRLPANPIHPEVIRNLPVRHPAIWLLEEVWK